MQFTKDTPVKLISFLRKLNAPRNTEARENYWKLIGQQGIVMDEVEMNNGRVLVLFEANLDDFGLENHNPLKNSIWIKKTDLEVIK